jgi:hypothetical protein
VMFFFDFLFVSCDFFGRTWVACTRFGVDVVSVSCSLVVLCCMRGGTYVDCGPLLIHIRGGT